MVLFYTISNLQCEEIKVTLPYPSLSKSEAHRFHFPQIVYFVRYALS